ncbi:MAG: hypothetical protein CVV42_12525 [Candidatus Riflebacteria bacterium HGW-Riflebacteria-2]|jgi:hypothetical protein|nr:MAG: hypothetical protein CVV42_12525 [Candidatus Riflebacteria bacterium HGW-Riflebacteria-2]
MEIDNRPAVIIILAILVLFISLPAQAVDLSATEITDAKGRVEVKKTVDAVFKKLHSNLKLAGTMKRLDGGDKVRTYEKSSAEMALKETCILGVKEQSIFEVPQVLGQEAIKQLNAQQGTILFKVVSGSNFQVQTADVIAGVKGTLFELDIVDNFVNLIETPAIQLGTLYPGATNVSVYKGEVELTHRQTNQKRTLKEGESISAVSSILMGLDPILGGGFTSLQKFIPIDRLTQRYSSQAAGLLNIGANIPGISQFQGLGNFNNVLENNRLSRMFDGMNDNIRKSVAGLEHKMGLTSAYEYIGNNEYLELGKDISEAFGKEFKADFSKFRKESRPFSVSDRYKEIFIGNQIFAACKATANSRMAKFEPLDEGLQLTEGNAAFRVHRFKNTSTDLEFIASHYLSDKKLVTTVKVLKGELYGRIPGSLEHFKVPNQEMSFVYDTETGQGGWVNASPGALDKDLATYQFGVAKRLAEEKSRHDKTSTEKKKQLGNKVLNKIKIKKFW